MWKARKTGEWRSAGQLPIRYVFTTPGKPVPLRIERFVVEEIPAPFSRFRHGGERYFVYLMERRVTDHWSALKEIERVTGIDLWKIGYAGIKDKRDVARQYITLPEKIDDISSETISLSFAGYSRAKFKPGMARGNRFEIWLSGVPKEFSFHSIEKVPNYFGLQRFGKGLDNHLRALSMIGRARVTERLKRLMLHSLQSWIFNEALARYIESGEVPDRIPLFSYSAEDPVTVEIAESLGIEPWEEREIERETWFVAEGLEEEERGDMRVVRFSLPKSCYATILLQEVAKAGIMK